MEKPGEYQRNSRGERKSGSAGHAARHVREKRNEFLVVHFFSFITIREALGSSKVATPLASQKNLPCLCALVSRRTLNDAKPDDTPKNTPGLLSLFLLFRLLSFRSLATFFKLSPKRGFATFFSRDSSRHPFVFNEFSTNDFQRTR